MSADDLPTPRRSHRKTAPCFTCRERPCVGESAYCDHCQPHPKRVGRFSGLDTTSVGGTRLCQCPLCDEIFSGESTFAQHRVAKGVRPSADLILRDCIDPAERGLVLNDHGVWRNPTG